MIINGTIAAITFAVGGILGLAVGFIWGVLAGLGAATSKEGPDVNSKKLIDLPDQNQLSQNGIGGS